jgi:hypothetical protein
MAKAFDKLKGKKEEEKPAENKDSADEGGEEENKDSNDEGGEENKDSADEGGEEENKDSDGEGKEDKKEDGCNKDSAPVVNFDANTINALVEALKPSITTAVKEVLGINKDSKPQGGEIDNANHETEVVSTRDYSSFLD